MRPLHIAVSARATAHVEELEEQRHATIHVNKGQKQLILVDNPFQLEDTCGRFLDDRVAMSLKCLRCCSNCCCKCSTMCGLTALSCLWLSPSSFPRSAALAARQVPCRCACVVRGQRIHHAFLTTLSVCSTRGTHHALDSHLLPDPQLLPVRTCTVFFLFVQVSTTQFCSFLFRIAHVNDGTNVPTSPTPTSSSTLGSPDRRSSHKYNGGKIRSHAHQKTCPVRCPFRSIGFNSHACTGFEQI